jgi:DNA-directed RNA polymerase specialized sigma24 family protein
MHDATSDGSDQGRNPEDLTRLLLRLDPDAGRAWEKYEGIRRRLAKFFEWNQCAGPEDLADEVLDRVAAKSDSVDIREVDKYSFGVARFVCLEAHKKMRRETHSEDLPGGENALPDAHDQPAEIVDKLYQESRLLCLRRCLARLMPGDRELVIQYYSAEEEKQKTFRRELAEKAGLRLGTLRVRTNRLREQLEECVKSCLESRRQQLISVS